MPDNNGDGARPSGSSREPAPTNTLVSPDAPAASEDSALADRDGGAAPFAVSAPLMRRLAAAADGHRDGQDKFFTARFTADAYGDFDIDGPHPDARTAARRLPGADYGVFGPFRTEPHALAKLKKPVVKVTVEVQGAAPIVLDGDKFDSLFWSASAVDKFLMPHYGVVCGHAYAAKVLRDFLQEDVSFMAHDPNTEVQPIGPQQPPPLIMDMPAGIRGAAPTPKATGVRQGPLFRFLCTGESEVV